MDRSLIEAAKAQTKISSLVRQRVKLKPVSGGFMGLCPFHAEKTPSLSIRDDIGRFKCFGCGAAGDIFDWLMIIKGSTFQEAYQELCGGPVGAFRADPVERAVLESEARKTDDSRRIAHAHNLWLKALPIAGTLAQRYLVNTRGIRGPIPDLLKYTRSAYCSVLGEETEALIAPLQDGNGHVTAVQQIFLCRETDDAWRDERNKRVKRTLGAMRDGAVRLGVPDTTLGLAGSVEDALAASSLYSLPVWATCGEQRMGRVWVPPEVDRVVIFADADDVGMRVAGEAKSAHQANGRKVTIMAPGCTKDFAGETERRAEAG
jgi:DNA primase